MVGTYVINHKDYVHYAAEIGCEVEVLKALASVESAGKAMLDNGQPKILFEAHIFSELTGGIYNATHPKISTLHWDRSLYIGGAGEHFRLQQAVKLDRNAALQSASWGMFQILGRNYGSCGFDNVQDFVNAMYQGELGQLKALVNFVKHEGIAPAMRDKEWRTIARKYNGPRYRDNKYDEKLEKAYKSFLN